MKKPLCALALLFVVLLASAPSASAKSFRFAVIGDNRSGDEIYSRMVESMMAEKPDFVVNTGDLIPRPGNRKQWKNFWRLSKPIDVPYYLTPGNHDIDDSESERIWRDEVELPGNETYYSFAKDGSLFIVLDTCVPDAYRRIEGPQLEWLKGELSKSGYVRKFVFLHHPLFLWEGAKHYGGSLDKYPKMRDELHELFRKSGVDIVFAGHEHSYRKMEKDGVLYVVTGGGGAPLYSGFNNYMIVDVDGGAVSARAVDGKGVVRDRFEMGRTSKAGRKVAR